MASKVAAALLGEHTATIVTPKQRVFQLLREMERRIDEVRQLLEVCA